MSCASAGDVWLDGLDASKPPSDGTGDRLVWCLAFVCATPSLRASCETAEYGEMEAVPPSVAVCVTATDAGVLGLGDFAVLGSASLPVSAFLGDGGGYGSTNGSFFCFLDGG